MASFFEKLKKGMGIEAPLEEEIGEKEEKIEIPKKSRVKKIVKEKPILKVRVKKLELKPKEFVERAKEEIEFSPEPETEEKQIEEEKIETKELSPVKERKPSFAEATEGKEKWANLSPELVGQLAIDVYQTEDDLIIQSAIAGVKPENLDISIEKDVINIKGNREKPLEENCDYFSQECYWGPFSREVILPAEVDPSRVSAEMKEGILTIRIPKIQREKKRKITVKG